MCDPKVSDIAKELRVSPPTIHRRIKRLEKKGYIQEYVAHADPVKLGKDLSSHIQLQIEYPKGKKITHEEFIKDYVDYFAKIKEVQGIYVPLGVWNLVLKVKTKNMLDHYRLISEKIMPLGKILRMESLVMMKTLKERSYVDPE